MDLNLGNKKFLVCGATSGFGRSVAENLMNEGAKVIAVARDKDKLNELADQYSDSVSIFSADLTSEERIEALFEKNDLSDLDGALINAGGPPAGNFLETEISDWDNAYQSVVRWKIIMTKKLVPLFRKNKYGRLLYIESASVKQPIENLVLSNSLRMAVVGMVKSLALDLASEGITLNIMAPGYHETQAVERLVNKKSENEKISYEEAKSKISSVIPLGFMGSPDDFGSLATWLLSEKSRYITGQTINIDGGVVKHVFG